MDGAHTGSDNEGSTRDDGEASTTWFQAGHGTRMARRRLDLEKGHEGGEERPSGAENGSADPCARRFWLWRRRGRAHAAKTEEGDYVVKKIMACVKVA
jgi:hypothetical protein